MRGKPEEALAILRTAEAQNPEDPDVSRMLSDLEARLAAQKDERDKRQAALSATRRLIMRFAGIGCLVIAYVLFRTTGSNGGWMQRGPIITAGPVLLGLRLVYWRFLGILALGLAGSAILIVSSYLDPDWASFDRP